MSFSRFRYHCFMRGQSPRLWGDIRVKIRNDLFPIYLEFGECFVVFVKLIHQSILSAEADVDFKSNGSNSLQ